MYCVYIWPNDLIWVMPQCSNQGRGILFTGGSGREKRDTVSSVWSRSRLNITRAALYPPQQKAQGLAAKCLRSRDQINRWVHVTNTKCHLDITDMLTYHNFKPKMGWCSTSSPWLRNNKTEHADMQTAFDMYFEYTHFYGSKIFTCV